MCSCISCFSSCCCKFLATAFVWFWMRVNDKIIWEKEKPEKVTKIAIQLFKEYISKESKNPINISYHIYSKLEKDIEVFIEPTSENNTNQGVRGKPNKDIFDESEKECMIMLEHDTLPRFCKSNLFNTEIIESGLLPKILKI